MAGRPPLLPEACELRADPAPNPPTPLVRAESRTLAAVLETQATLLTEILQALEIQARSLRAVADLLRTQPSPAPAPAPPAWVSLPEAARLTRRGETTLRRLIRQGLLPAQRDPVTREPCQPYRVPRWALDALCGVPDA